MRTREIERLAWGTDAGFYRLLPQEDLMPADEGDVIRIVSRAAVIAPKDGIGVSSPRPAKDEIQTVFWRKKASAESAATSGLMIGDYGAPAGGCPVEQKPFGLQIRGVDSVIEKALVGSEMRR